MSQPSLPESNDPQLLENEFNTLFCRALYNYEAQDPSALSFQRDDIIEVLTQQPSGWWDGLLGEERGWFPSNYVTIISDEEAEAAFASMEQNTLDTATDARTVSSADISPSISRRTQVENEEWLDNELSYRTPEDASRTAPSSSSNQPSDFWLPEVTPDGQIYYVNSQTGQRSRDLPQETDEDASDRDLAGFSSQPVSRSGTSVGLPFGPGDLAEASSDSERPLGQNGGSEWVRRRADDGVSFYYFNTLDGRVRWTEPESTPHSRNGSNPAPTSHQPSDTSRLSVYSDDSDVQPFDHLPGHRQRPQNGVGRRPQPPAARSEPNQAALMELTAAERIAKSLQQALEPGPPNLINDLSAASKGAIQAVIRNVQSGGVVRDQESNRILDELVYGVVLAIRNLLYVGAAPPASSSSGRDGRTNSSTNPLKPTQRKVTATLSRLVLSARAMQYDSGSQLSDTLSRIETDSEELERAVDAFVFEVRRYQGEQSNNPDRKPKRLQGVFATSNIGLGLVGGGQAGSWKGFGWVPLDESAAPPQKVLGTEVLVEVGASLDRIHESLNALGQALRIVTDDSVPKVQFCVQELITLISAFLSLVNDVHVARHVDIDGIRQAGDDTANDHYSHSVDNARRLVRSLEAVVQTVYDDSSAILLTTQTLREGDRSLLRGEREAAFDLIDTLSTSLGTNLNTIKQTFESLLSVGHEQADIAQGDYTGSIEWRMSRLSVINDHFAGIQDTLPPRGGVAGDAYHSENEDVVDMEFAVNRPGLRKQRSVAGSGSHDPYGALAGRVGSEPSLENSTLVTPSQSGGPDDFADNDDTLYDDGRPKKAPARSAGAGKLINVLGEEYAEKVAADLQPWYLRPNYAPEDIIIDPDGSVRGGTVPALVERLTAHEGADPTFSKAFLLTFKSFTTLDELFDLLVARFRIQAPEHLSQAERDQWSKFKQHAIQLRVLNTLKSMINDEDVLEKEDFYIFDRMKEFLSLEETSKLPAAKSLINQITRLQTGGGDTKTRITTTLGPPPTPIVPKTNKKLKFLDIDPLELARQLTIMESQLYQRIKPMECLQRAKEQKTDTMDNIALVIQTSNRIADWVADLVLSKEDSRRRAQVVKHLISVADRCRALNNFSTMIAITSGLNTPPIRRLKRTWEQVPQRFMSMFNICEMTIDSNKNFTKYRQLMASVTPPCVPFIGVFLSTLLFIQTGNKDMLPGGLVNFRKRQKASEVINDIKRWQAQPFNLQPLTIVLTFINESLAQYNSDTRASSEHFWALSLEREPREREDEKMARLLQESGFL